MSTNADVLREAANARKRINRRIDELQKELKRTGIASTRYGRELKSTIKILGEMRESTKVRKADKTKRSEAEIRENIVASESIAPSMRQFRKNIQTMQEMNLPFRKDGSIGRYSEIEVRTFFAATRRAWGGKYYGERLSRIMQYYGASDLSKLIETVLDLTDTELMRRVADKSGDEIIDENELNELSPNDTEDNENKGYPNIYKDIIEAAQALSLDEIKTAYKARNNL